MKGPNKQMQQEQLALTNLKRRQAERERASVCAIEGEEIVKEKERRRREGKQNNKQTTRETEQK